MSSLRGPEEKWGTTRSLFSLSDRSDHSDGSDHMEFILETNYPSRRIIRPRWIIRL